MIEENKDIGWCNWIFAAGPCSNFVHQIRFRSREARAAVAARERNLALAWYTKVSTIGFAAL
jgi:hypothetical protein